MMLLDETMLLDDLDEIDDYTLEMGIFNIIDFIIDECLVDEIHRSIELIMSCSLDSNFSN